MKDTPGKDMTTTPIIILMGLRGSGKTTVGQLVAGLTGLTFVDLDDVTPGHLGEASAADAINSHGLDAFRLAEIVALREVLGQGPLVLALGGGTPTAPGATHLLREQIKQGAVLAYLHAPPGALRHRLSATDTTTRPSLTGKGTLDEIDEVYLRRDPLYKNLCTRLIETDGVSATAIAAMIV